MSKQKKLKKSSSSKRTREAFDELPVKQLSELSNLNSFVFYGRAGTGKTTLAGTFPGPILLLDVKDRGTDSLDEDDFDGEVMEIKSWDDFDMTYWWLRKAIKNKKCKYKTIALDTGSQLQHLAVIKVLEDKGKDTSKAGDWGTMTKQDWGTVSSMMKEAITNLRDLRGVKVVINAQDRVFNVGDDEVDPEERLAPEVGPRLSPATMSHLNAEFSVIGNTFIKMKTVRKKSKKRPGKIIEIEKPVYCLRIGPNPTYVTKVRKAKKLLLPDVIEDPDYEKIMEVLKPNK